MKVNELIVDVVSHTYMRTPEVTSFWVKGSILFTIITCHDSLGREPFEIVFFKNIEIVALLKLEESSLKLCFLKNIEIFAL